MRVLVQEIISPPGSTVGRGSGIDPTDGRLVVFCGDYRPMADIRTALDQHADDPVFALVEDWQVTGAEVHE